MNARRCIIAMAMCAFAGCASLQDQCDLDTIDSGIQIVNTMTTKSVLERISNCAYDKRIRKAAKQRLEFVSTNSKEEFDAKIAEAVIELRGE